VSGIITNKHVLYGIGSSSSSSPGADGDGSFLMVQGKSNRESSHPSRYAGNQFLPRSLFAPSLRSTHPSAGECNKGFRHINETKTCNTHQISLPNYCGRFTQRFSTAISSLGAVGCSIQYSDHFCVSHSIPYALMR
jgi:hypothetical protein